jgi:hypothetical protein
MMLFSLVSCLKDQDFKDHKIGHRIDDQNIIEMAAPNSATSKTTISMEIVDKDTVMKLIPIRLASGAVAANDIVVTLDTSYTSTYVTGNLADNAALKHFSGLIGSLESGLTVTIPRGSNEAFIKVKLNSSKFDPSNQYVLAYKIKSVSDPNYLTSGLLYSHAFIFSAKNKFDGVYKLTGNHNRVPYDFMYEDIEMHLVTLSGNSVACYWPEAGGFGHPIGVGPGQVSWYGAGIAPVFVFDLATNNVTGAYNQGGATVISLYTNATGPGAMANKYDIAKKTLYISWMYNNRQDRAFFDTFVYVKKRP